MLTFWLICAFAMFVIMDYNDNDNNNNTQNYDYELE